ncbi:polysaccharide deacetylase family protein [Dethiobacter alkaliphilus]|uniref:polysaccharide deacetylase family protein n=1 Tax=Dethiobacter alkaliphilus TaxID=427926 RepID=UPI002226B782|nr:polysaccharide deacetylase family protein [Dethiobacter alkaliphilus]MCW3490831.1 polysaccharide deacetylase family protein [Dethiobacter alkaliphilus]
MIRDKRIKKRKQRVLLAVVAVLIVLSFVLHRQITQGVFSPTISGAYYHVATDEKAVSLTFDAVWQPGELPRILDILDRYEVQATFFLPGTWLRYNADLAREILLRGHEIGHHGYAHKRLTELNEEELSKEFALMEEALQEELNVQTQLFRPPYGEINQEVYDYIADRGYTTVLWSVDPHDWLDPGVDKIITRVIKRVHNGAIILFHTNATQAVDALPVIIQSLKMQEYEILPVTQLLEKEK